MAAVTPKLAQFRRVVVKVGSSLLVDSKAGTVNADWLRALAADLSDFATRGASVLVVSSGAIALGRTVVKLPPGALKLEESQAAAAVGQIALAGLWTEALADVDLTAGQILLTLGDTEERRRYLNARETIGKLLELGAVPIINENDTVATTEIRYGDNDRLAARVATMTSADLLILLSDVDGLYSAPPRENPSAKLIPIVPRVTAEIEAMAGAAESELARGGMRTKIEAAKIATAAGTHMVIASGRKLHPVRAIAEGGPCTWFLTPANPVTARKKWIAGALEPKGAIHFDAGAVAALESAVDARDPRRQQALARAQGSDRAGVERERAFRLERPGDPALARGHRIGRREEPGAGRALGDGLQRMRDAARGDHHMRAGGGGDLRRFDLGLHAAARQLGARGAGHRLDLGTDARHQRHQLGVAPVARRRVVKPVDVGEQHQEIGARHGGDAGGEAIIVPIADFRRRDRVVLIDHRHGAQRQKPRQAFARIEIEIGRAHV